MRMGDAHDKMEARTNTMISLTSHVFHQWIPAQALTLEDSTLGYVSPIQFENA
jgi:hypothetical protein